MKTEMSRSQLLAVSIGFGVVVVAGGLAWLGFSSLVEKQAEAQALADKTGNPALANLLSESGGAGRATREAAEIQKLGQELLDKDRTTEGWSRATEKLCGDGQLWAQDPGKWKDELIATQSRLQKAAKEMRVKLDPDFYLGLEAYRQKSPTAEEVPSLALHLAVAEWLTTLLLKAREAKEQYPTACELRALTGPGSADNATNPIKPVLPPPPGGKGTAEPERKTFRLAIRASPEVLYEYVRKISHEKLPGDEKALPLLIVTDLTVANTKPSFPLRTEIGKRFSANVLPAEGGGATRGGEEKKLLEILAGEEALDVNLVVDFVVWKNPKEGKPGVQPPSSP